MLHFMRWLKEHHPEIKFDTLALKGGELKESFEEVADKFYEVKQQSPGYRMIEKMLSLFMIQGRARPGDKLFRKLAGKKPDIVYANSITTIPIGLKIKEQNPKTIFVAHVHELQTVIDIVLPNLKNFVPSVDMFFTASEMVRKNLIENYQITSGKVKTIYECAAVAIPGQREKRTKGFRVGASGTFHWRKGGDVFLQVVRHLKIHYSQLDIEFVWIGALPKMELIIAEADIKKMGLEDMIWFSGLQENPGNYYKDLDVFLLPSREDPFPLVCIEVGMLGIPVICFEKATGTAEILKKGGGVVVPYLDAAAMAEQVVLYYQNPETRSRDGKRNRELFSGFTPEKICPEIFKHLENQTLS